MSLTANLTQVYALREQIAKLTPEEQLILAEAILRGIRDAHFTDHEAYRQAVREDYEAMLAREAAGRA